jgi:YHS domain-containing protein
MHASSVRCAFAGAFVLIALSLFLAAPAGAGQFGIGLYGSFNQYAMRDIDKAIGELGDNLDVIAAPDHFELNTIETGLGGGAGLRYEMSRKLVFSLDYSRLGASQEGTHQVGGMDATASVSFPANAFLLSGTYYFPTESDVRFGVLGGLGYYSCSGEMKAEFKALNLNTTETVSGSGIGFHAGVSADGHLKGPMRIEGSAGYRYARTGQLEYGDGTPVTKSDGGETRAEYTGSYMQVGLVYYFGKRSGE